MGDKVHFATREGAGASGFTGLALGAFKAKKWDGITWGGFKQKLDPEDPAELLTTNRIPVMPEGYGTEYEDSGFLCGDGTGYNLGPMTLEQAVILYWRFKKLKVSFTPRSISLYASLTGGPVNKSVSLEYSGEASCVEGINRVSITGEALLPTHGSLSHYLEAPSKYESKGEDVYAAVSESSPLAVSVSPVFAYDIDNPLDYYASVNVSYSYSAGVQASQTRNVFRSASSFASEPNNWSDEWSFTSSWQETFLFKFDEREWPITLYILYYGYKTGFPPESPVVEVIDYPSITEISTLVIEPVEYWPYKNSAGEDVFNTTSGDQEADIS